MVRTTRAVFLIAALMSFSINPAPAGSSEDLKKAGKLRSAGHHKEAIELCTKIIKTEKADKRILRKAYMQRARELTVLKSSKQKMQKKIDAMK